MPYRLATISHPVNLKENFWKLNPQLKFITPFKELYDSDKSENKMESSKTMICVWLYCDPTYDNKIYRLEEQLKKSSIVAYKSDFDFEDETINNLIFAYKENCLTKAAKAFIAEEASLVQRSELIKKVQDEQGYTLDEFVPLGNNRWGNKKGTAKQLDDIRKATKVIYSQYEQVKAIFEEEQNSVRLHGGGKETLMENGGMMLIVDDDED